MIKTQDWFRLSPNSKATRLNLAALATIGLLASSLLWSGCGVGFHEHYTATTVKKDVYATVENDSVQISFISPADIDYFTTEDEAKTFMKKTWQLNDYKNILVMGKSNESPLYSFVLIMDSPETFDNPTYSGIRIHAFQKIIGGHRFDLIAHGAEANLRPTDFEKILESLKVK